MCRKSIIGMNSDEQSGYPEAIICRKNNGLLDNFTCYWNSSADRTLSFDYIRSIRHRYMFLFLQNNWIEAKGVSAKTNIDFPTTYMHHCVYIRFNFSEDFRILRCIDILWFFHLPIHFYTGKNETVLWPGIRICIAINRNAVCRSKCYSSFHYQMFV